MNSHPNQEIFAKETMPPTNEFQKGLSNVLLVANEEWKMADLNGKEIEIPKDWELACLGEISVIHGGIPSPKEFNKDGKPFIRVSCLHHEGTYVGKDHTKEYLNGNHKYVPKGTLLVAKSGESIHQKYRNLTSQDSVIVGHIAGIEAANGNSIEYIRFQLENSPFEKNLAQGGATPSISVKDLKSVPVLMATPLEQIIIAQILTTQESQIHDLRKLAAVERQRLSWLSDELLSGRLRVELDRDIPDTVLVKSDSDQGSEERLPGVRIVANESWKTVELNGDEVNIPENWELSCLGKTSVIHGGIPAPKEFNKNGKPFIRVSCLHHKGTHVGKDHTKEYLNGNYKHVPKGTLLVAKSGESIHQNYRNLTSQDCVIVGHIAGIEAVNGNSIEYIRFQLKNSPFERSLAQGGATPSISMKDLDSVPVLMADPLEQNRIAQILTAQENQVSDIEKLIEVEQKRLEWLSDELLSGRIRVKQASQE